MNERREPPNRIYMIEQDHHGKRPPSPRAERENLLRFSLGFLSEKPNRITIEDQPEKPSLKPMDILMQESEQERTRIANSMIVLLEQLLPYVTFEAEAKLLPTPQAKIITKLKETNQDILTIARRLYARLDLPIPEEFALKSGNK